MPVISLIPPTDLQDKKLCDKKQWVAGHMFMSLWSYRSLTCYPLIIKSWMFIWLHQYAWISQLFEIKI